MVSGDMRYTRIQIFNTISKRQEDKFNTKEIQINKIAQSKEATKIKQNTAKD